MKSGAQFSLLTDVFVRSDGARSKNQGHRSQVYENGHTLGYCIGVPSLVERLLREMSSKEHQLGETPGNAGKKHQHETLSEQILIVS